MLGVVRRSVSVMMLRSVIVSRTVAGDVGHHGVALFCGPFGGHRGRGADADEPVGQGLANAAHQQRDVGALAAPVGVQLVQHQEAQPLALRMTALSMSFCRVISSSSIMKLVSRMSGGLAAMACRSSSLSWPV
jgi:hypothetical protein